MFRRISGFDASMNAFPVKVVVVLAGGEGRRMGGAKPLRAYGPTTLIGRAVELAASYGETVAVAVRDPAQLGATTPAHLLFDDPALGGPIAGLASALRFATERDARTVMTLPCDTPRLPSDLATRLCAALAANGDVAMAASDGRLHPTCALWRAHVAARLPAYVAAGASSLRGFAKACGMVVVDWPGGAGDAFANANTPEDLRRLQPA
jgi:molybdopterin-guanine dinucleotide biosynthesis protein A